MIRDLIAIIEQALSPKAKGVIAALLLSVISVLSYLATHPERVITDSTVMITNHASNSGGTGVVIESHPGYSIVLTNSHVCGVISQAGGLVHADNGDKHVVAGFKRSQQHDLCLIKVLADLGVETPVAAHEPKLYTKATVSGHPSLYPTAVTEGLFSGHRIISVAIGYKPCKGDLSPTDQFYCAFFGMIPDIRQFEAQLVTATIMPGSSGSAVFNSRNEIAGLVFAGRGELGYAFIVPHSFVYDFVNKESNLYPFLKPGDEPSSEVSTAEAKKRIRQTCSTNEDNDQVREVCNILNTGTVK
jgi:S1-C subfamily serine protease